MPRALEILDVTVRGIERGEITAIEAIDALLTEELTLRENRLVKWRSRWPSLGDQDPRRLRLRLPALARQEPRHGARRFAVHRSRRGRPPDRSARARTHNAHLTMSLKFRASSGSSSDGGPIRERFLRRSASRATSARPRSEARMAQGPPLQDWFAGNAPSTIRRRTVAGLTDKTSAASSSVTLLARHVRPLDRRRCCDPCVGRPPAFGSTNAPWSSSCQPD